MQYYKKSIYGELLDHSSTDNDDDTVSKLTNPTKGTTDLKGDVKIPPKSTRDHQVNTQYSDISTDSDSSSYACEETRLPPIMGTEKPMELIELPNSDAASVDTTPAMIAPSSTQKLEDQFDKEVYIPMMKQPTSMKKKKSITAPPHITTTAQASQQVVQKKTSATPTHITTITKGSHPVDQNIDFIFLDEVDIMNNANDALEMKPSATKSQHPVEPEDFNSQVFNDEEDSSKVMDSSILD